LNRWLGKDRESNKAKLVGFGLGTRACVGRDLAWSELFLVIANLIRHFNFELVDETLTPVYKFLYRPKEKSFKVKLSKKS
jgi:cytochrome P450